MAAALYRCLSNEEHGSTGSLILAFFGVLLEVGVKDLLSWISQCSFTTIGQTIQHPPPPELSSSFPLIKLQNWWLICDLRSPDIKCTTFGHHYGWTYCLLWANCDPFPGTMAHGRNSLIHWWQLGSGSGSSPGECACVLRSAWLCAAGVFQPYFLLHQGVAFHIPKAGFGSWGRTAFTTDHCLSTRLK